MTISAANRDPTSVPSAGAGPNANKRISEGARTTSAIIQSPRSRFGFSSRIHRQTSTVNVKNEREKTLGQ